MTNRDETWLLTEKYHGEKTALFYADCARLAAGEPLAYLIGSIPFLSTTITLNSRPLIPRPETEFWVETFLTTHPSFGEARVLDLCAGSGAIGVAVGHAALTATVDFVELDRAHEETIRHNWELNNGTDRTPHTYIGHLYTALPPDLRYDFILSNPPYIDAALGRVAASVQDFEPALALYGGSEGLDLIRDIITSAPDHLRTGGELWLEHEPEQDASIAELGRAAGFTVHTQTDQYGVIRFSRLVLQ